MISETLRRRLAQLEKEEQIRVLVFFNLPGSPVNTRQDLSQRQAEIARIIESTKAGVEAVDRILEECGGDRLSPEPDALGNILVRTNREGVEKMASCNHVRGIVEDQPISFMDRMSHSSYSSPFTPPIPKPTDSPRE